MSKPADAQSESGVQGHEPSADCPRSGATVVLRRSDLRGRHLLSPPFIVRRNRPVHRGRHHRPHCDQARRGDSARALQLRQVPQTLRPDEGRRRWKSALRGAMVKVEHITKDWKEAGSFAAQVNLYGFWDEHSLSDEIRRPRRRAAYRRNRLREPGPRRPGLRGEAPRSGLPLAR